MSKMFSIVRRIASIDISPHETPFEVTLAGVSGVLTLLAIREALHYDGLDTGLPWKMLAMSLCLSAIRTVITRRRLRKMNT